MKYLRTALFLLAALLAPAVAGCRMTAAAGAQNAIPPMRSGSLALDDAPGSVPGSLYIDWRDREGRRVMVPEVHAASFQALGYRLVDKPSRAGYILHITILARGEVSREKLAALVSAGYGSAARFGGHGVSAILADMLLVQRKVPGGSKPAQARLKNIARRNAVSSSRMRLAVCSDGREGAATAESLRDALLAETRASLPLAAGAQRP